MLTRRVRSVVVLSVLIGGACGKSPREKSFSEVLPVAELGVEIGMSEKTVRRVRPQATLGPYTGLVEEIGRDRAVYTFPRTGESKVPMFAKLSRVVYSRTFDGDSTEALAMLAAEIERVTALLGAPTQCRTFEEAGQFRFFSVWSEGKSQFEVGTTIMPDFKDVWYALSEDRPPSSATTVVPCDRLTR